ncbi:fibronectin type III domain-containing protein [Paenibacillus thiaminolyticus]|uniref:fibronectin type III domain-containing protein n=1 Tax=Paenibacillus thiaminolyticus TaxID=49283 RepID=UPI0035A5A783
MLKGLSVSILAATMLFSAGSGAVLAEPLQASTVEAKAVSQAAVNSIKWNTVPGASYYRVSIRDLQANQRIVDEHIYGTSFSTSLTSGNQYRIWVGAFNNDGVLIKQRETIERVYGGTISLYL